MASGDRQRSRGRDEQKRADERAGENGGGLTERSNVKHGQTPLELFCRTRLSDPCLCQCTGYAKWKLPLFFSASACGSRNSRLKSCRLLAKITNAVASLRSCSRLHDGGPGLSCSWSPRRRRT